MSLRCINTCEVDVRVKNATAITKVPLRQSKLQLTGQNLGRVFNSTSGCKCAVHMCCYKV
jgi:hypothetical protein